ncbi:MAG TPA: sugar ABC transporter permease [Phototrophicaceae bacterium]|nr:sugar ABC transporter permease [Phototrophicaceae bacterium]
MSAIGTEFNNRSAAGGPSSRRSMSDVQIVRLFIFPTIILLILMNIFPLIYSLFLSFTNYSVIADKAPEWVGLANYQHILTDERFWTNFAITGRYALVSVLLQTLIGFGLAMLLRNKFRGSGLITTLILVPMMLSPIVVAVFWKLIFNPSVGILNYMIGYTDINTAPEWLGRTDLALWAVIIVDVWMWSPFVMLLCLAGLSAIPEYLYEAAAIDRAGTWFQFRRITLPQVMPLLLIAVLFRTIEAFKQFDLVMGLTGGGPGDVTETVSIRLYKLAFQGQYDTGTSSALAYVILVIIIAISNIYIRQLNQAREG